MRLPSCVGLSNGRHWHPDPGRISQYITCEGERTVAIDDCAEGMYYEQIVQDCLPLKYYSKILFLFQLIDWCLKTTLVIFQLYHGMNKFYYYLRLVLINSGLSQN